MLKKIKRISSFCLVFLLVISFFIQTVNANEKIDLYIRYISETELTEKEKALIKKDKPSIIDKDNEVIYMIYRPIIKTQEVLPQAGSSNINTYILAGSILILSGVIVLKSKKRSTGIFSAIFIVSTFLGTFPINVKAIKSNQLNIHDYKITVDKNQNIPDIIQNIEGYDYVGYFVASENLDDKLETRVYQEIKTLEFKTITTTDENLDSGKIIEKGGLNGSIITSFEEVSLNGEILDLKQLDQVVKAPIDKEIVVGTKKQITKRQYQTTEEIDFETENIVDDNLPQGKVTIIDGVKGSITITFEETLINGIVVETKEIDRVVVPAKNKQIITGTKKIDPIIIKDLNDVNGELKDNVDIEILDSALKNITFNVTGLPKDLNIVDNKIVGQFQETGIFPIVVVYQDENGQEVTKNFTISIISDAEKAGNQLVDQKQEVFVGENPEALNSINVTDLSDFLSVKWLSSPDTSSPKDAVAKLLVEFVDGSSKEFDVIVKVNNLKIKAIVEIESIDKHELTKTVTIRYNKIDPDNSYISANAELYKGTDLVKKIPIENIDESLEINDLEYNVEYTLKTELVYNLGKGIKHSIEDDVENFILEFKYIELKDIDNVSLFKKSKDNFIHVNSLDNSNIILDEYFAKISSSDYKDVYLPIVDIKEVSDNTNSYFELTANTDELIQKENNIYRKAYRFSIEKTPIKKSENEISNFSELISAINNNPDGSFVLINDISASEYNLAVDSLAYIENFNGNLSSLDQKQYAIHDLKAPLFNQLNGANISKLDIKNSNIISDKHHNLGVLANRIKTSNISDVSVSSSISSTKDDTHVNVGGIAGLVENSNISNVLFKGDIKSSASGKNTVNIGGVAGLLVTNSGVSKAKADVDIKIFAKSNNHKAGSIIGRIEYGKLNFAYGSGKILNTGYSGQIGGIVGSVWPNGAVNNAISNVYVKNGNVIYGDQNHRDANIRNTFAIENEVEGNIEKWSQLISKTDAQLKLDSYQITANLEDSDVFEKINNYQLNLENIQGYDPSKIIAYQNTLKLLPFYNQEYIVTQGNKIKADSKLNKVLIDDVVTMIDNRIIINPIENKEQINRLMIHYKDGTVAFLTLQYKGLFKNQRILEYNIPDEDIIFTPEFFVSDYEKIVNRLQNEIRDIEYFSEPIYQKIGLSNSLSNDMKQEKLQKLYLENSFNDVKNNIAYYLKSLLAQDSLINTESQVVEDYLLSDLLKNKENLLINLAYLNRWSNINYDDINIKDLIIFKQDFYGDDNLSSLKTVVDSSKYGYEMFNLANNINSFSLIRNSNSDKDELFEFLEYNHKLFIKDKTLNEWFVASSKANIKEMVSDVDANIDVSLYNKLTKKTSNYKDMVLPLLNLTKENKLFIISTIASITFGIYDRYLDRRLETSNPLNYQREVERVNTMVEEASKWQKDHYDTWYRLLPEDIKPRYLRDLPVWDDFMEVKVNNRHIWLPEYGDTAQGILDFFGPLGRWHVKWNDSGAFANGSSVYYVWNRVLDRYGSSVLTHEMVHNSDGGIYFRGHGRRDGLGAENYALGFLQVPNSSSHAIVGVNLMFDFTFSSQSDRLHAINPNVYTDQNALDLYVTRMHDLMYTLHYAEAKSVLKESKDIHKKWFNKLETINGAYGQNLKRSFTEAEWENMNLQTVDDLIENDVIVKREYNEGTLGRNGYYVVGLFAPIFATADNPRGAPGDLSFRATAYEIWAEKGYDGFLSYVSNKHKKESELSGETVLSDKFVFDKIFDQEYSNYKEFKKAMYQKRITKLNKLKEVTIYHDNRNIVINSFDDIEALMDQAVKFDIRNNYIKDNRNSKVRRLKANLYNAYLIKTNDFRDSIFSE